MTLAAAIGLCFIGTIIALFVLQILFYEVMRLIKLLAWLNKIGKEKSREE